MDLKAVGLIPLDTVYKTPVQVTGFLDRLFARLNTLPGVRQTGAVSDLLMNSSSNVIISVEGHTNETERVGMIFCRRNTLDSLYVSSLRGRLLQPHDQLGKQHAAVISAGLAKNSLAA